MGEDDRRAGTKNNVRGWKIVMTSQYTTNGRISGSGSVDYQALSALESSEKTGLKRQAGRRNLERQAFDNERIRKLRWTGFGKK